ncbi:MAG TPA: SCO family protein, partial [Polyangiales bacterium]|nr:SCO family protein [Polyangiales bacterium]
MRLWAAGLAVLLGLSACRGGEPALADYGPMPEFELRDQRDALVRSAELEGRVLIVDFIFTTCPDVCPLLTQQLVGVRKQLAAKSGIAYVSFSVDPEHDTPEKLKQFAVLHGADQPDWYFLTGPLERVREVVTRGFKQAMQLEPVEEGKPRNVLHGSHFVLVDRSGTI